MQIDDSAFDACGFMPWIGPDYQNGGFHGLRVLILGESHYSWDLEPDQVRYATRRVVQDELSGAFRHRFHARVLRVMRGSRGRLPGEEISRFWNGVAFYNYVQEFVGNSPRDRPSPAQWEHAATVLPTVLAALRPHFVLACGRGLYEHLKLVPDLTSAPEFGADDYTRSREIATGSGERGVVGLIYHPASVGFSARKWAPRAQQYLSRARRLSGVDSSTNGRANSSRSGGERQL